VHPEYVMQGCPLPQLADDSPPAVHFSVNVSQVVSLVSQWAPSHFQWVDVAVEGGSRAAPAAPTGAAGGTAHKLLCLHQPPQVAEVTLALYSSYISPTQRDQLARAGAEGVLRFCVWGGGAAAGGTVCVRSRGLTRLEGARVC
jgi:hypothetical protein